MDMANYGVERANIAQMMRPITEIKDLKRLAHKDQHKALEAAAKQFEALFVQQMMKTMRQTRFDDTDLMSSDNVRFFQSLHDEKLVEQLSAQDSLGLADQIVAQLSPQKRVSSLNQLQLQKISAGQETD